MSETSAANRHLTKLLDDELLGGCAAVLADCAGVVPPRETLITLLTASPDIVFTAAQWGADDTVVREELSTMAVRALGVASRWPTFADNVDIDAFDGLVCAAARSHGWFVRADSGRWPGFTS